MKTKKIIAGMLSLATLATSVQLAQTGVFQTALANELVNDTAYEDMDYFSEETYPATAYTEDTTYDYSYNTETTTTESKKSGLGDVNGDYSVDSRDAVYILQYYADVLAGNETSEIDLDLADVNNDGKITTKDAHFILRFYANSLAGKDMSFDDIAMKDGKADYTVNISVGSVEVSKTQGVVEIPVTISDNSDSDGIVSSAIRYTVNTGDLSCLYGGSSRNGDSLVVTEAWMVKLNNDEMYSLVYKLPSDAKVGDVYDITLYVEEAANEYGEDVTVKATGGKVKVVDKIEDNTEDNTSDLYSYEHSKDKETVIEVAKVKVDESAIGSTIDIPVRIFNNPGFYATGILYTASVGNFEDSIKKGLLKPDIAAKNNAIAVTSGTPKIYDGVLYTLRYTVPDNVKAGDIIDIQADLKLLIDGNEREVEAKIYGGKITIADDKQETTTAPTTTTATTTTSAPITPGDLNGDGKIDSKDAVIVLQKYAEELVKPGSSKEYIKLGDINGDGKLDSKDAVKILQTYANALVNGN